MAPPIKVLIASLFTGSASAAAVSTRLAGDCTTVATVTVDQPMPDWPDVHTLTKYATSITVHKEVNCNGCNYIDVVTQTKPLGGAWAPFRERVIVVTKDETSTITRYHCPERLSQETKEDKRQLVWPELTATEASTLVLPTQSEEGDNNNDDSEDRGRDFEMPSPLDIPDCSPSHARPCSIRFSPKLRAPCTRSLFRKPGYTFGPTSTVWATTVTVTNTVPCWPCTAADFDYNGFGIPPVVFFNATITTDAATTTTTLECTKREVSTQTVLRIPPRSVEAEATPKPTKLMPGGQQSSSFPSPSLSPLSAHPPYPAITTPPTLLNSQYWSPPPGTTGTIVFSEIEFPMCTRVIGLPADRPDPTLTIYPSTVTTTSLRFCGTCALIWSTRTILPLMPVKYTTTTTAVVPSIATALECLSWDIENLRPTVEPLSSAEPSSSAEPTSSPFHSEKYDKYGDAMWDLARGEQDEWIWN